MIDFVTNRQVLLGENTLTQLPSVMEWNGKKNALLVVYHREAECVKKIEGLLQAAGVSCHLYDKVVKEPDLTVIDDGVQLCIELGCDSVIAVGGGSVIDAAKTIAMMATNGGTVEQYQLEGKEVTKLPLFFVAVPTTAGTGAEATRVSVVYNGNKGFKKALYHNSMIAQTVILDPTTTTGLPAKVTAATGMDAITHAIESYVSVNANPISRMYSLRALELLVANIATACREPENLAAREAMLLGSYFAGCAISVGTCLAHIVGQPVGAIFSIPHGDSCSIFLLPSMRLNRDYALSQYVDIAKVLGVDAVGKSDVQIVDESISLLEQLYTQIDAPTRLTQYVETDKVDVDAVLDNIQTSMGHIKTNPRPVSRELFRELLLSVL